MEDDETVDSGVYGQPCGACEYRRTDCGPDCIFVPFFPAGSRADFARVRALIGEDTLTNVINNNLGPELRSAIVKFMIIEARARADGSARGRNLSIANAASLLSGILRHLLDCLVILTLIDRHLLGGYLFRSVETATSLQDVQEAGGGDVEGGGDREDRGSGSMEGSVEGAPAAVLDDGDNEEDEG